MIEFTRHWYQQFRDSAQIPVGFTDVVMVEPKQKMQDSNPPRYTAIPLCQDANHVGIRQVK